MTRAKSLPARARSALLFLCAALALETLLALGGAAVPSPLSSGLLFAAAAIGAGRGRARPADTVQGSARFATPREAIRELGGAGLVVGRAAADGRAGLGAPGALLRYAGPSHLLTFAPTRSGKGVGAVLPNLLALERGVICVDPKGENARIAGRRREETGPVFTLDPFGASGRAPAAFNPLARLDPESDDAAEEAAALAEALVHDAPHQSGEAHWNEEAKALLAGLMLHVASDPRPQARTLGELRARLTRPREAFILLLEEMQASSGAGGLIARSADRHLAKADREAAGVLSAAHRHTHFLDTPKIVRSLSRTDFDFEAVRLERASVFLVLPPDRLATQARWLRLLLVHALGALLRLGARPDLPPALLLLDEFAALGRLDPVLQAYGLMAGYGVQIWAFLQDLHQLRSVYGRAAGVFLSNSGLTQVFNVADVETAEWVARTLGVGTAAAASGGLSASAAALRGPPSLSLSAHAGPVRRELLTADEVLRLPPEALLLFRPSAPPVLARKVRHFADPEFAGRFDP